jgi:hypothetical protein
MHILFISDSYGGPRIHNNVADVPMQDTYPELARKELEAMGHTVESDSASFRKITDLPFVLKKHPAADLYIIQAGIVDLYPRPLSQEFTLSQSFLAKSVRRVVRLNRAFFVKYVRNKPWSTGQEITAAIHAVLSDGKKCIWINAAPVNKFQDRQSPGANESIREFNMLLSRELKKYPSCTELNIYHALLQLGDYERYMHPVDSHPNKEGNRFYAETIMRVIKENNFSFTA